MSLERLLYDAAAFDLDGVLHRGSENNNVLAALQAFAERGWALSQEEIGMVVGRSAKICVPMILQGRGISLDCAPEIIRRYRENYAAIWPGQAKVADGLHEVLARLKGKGFKLAIATTNVPRCVEAFLRLFFPEGNPFDAIVTGADIVNHKPDPEIYLKAAERLGIEPRRILAVEDTELGVEAARAAGMRCAAFPDELSMKHNFSKACYVLESLRDLLAIMAI